MKEQSSLPDSLVPSFAMLGISAGIGMMMLGGLKKMLGSTDEIKHRDLICGMIDGFMTYIREREDVIDELATDIKMKDDQIETHEKNIDRYQESVDDFIKDRDSWKSKYYSLLSKQRKKRKK